MNSFIKTTLTALALVVGVTVGGIAEARQLGFIVGATAVDDVTTTVCTLGNNSDVKGFGNGVSMDQVWALEVEVGSPGSGAFASVSGYTDVFPNVNGSAAVGGITQYFDYVSERPACFRLHMTTDGGGTAQIQLVTEGTSPSAEPTDVTHSKHYDDFRAGVVPITVGHATQGYVVHLGAGTAVLSVIEAEAEGTLTFSGGEAGTDADLSTGTFGLIGEGALVSDGLTVVEFRVAMSQIADNNLGFGVTDVVSAGTEIVAFEANTNVVAEGAVATTVNAAAIFFNTDSNDAQGDFWLLGTLNANTMGNAADEYSLGVGGTAPVAAKYEILRLEIEATGDVYAYLNGVLQGVEPVGIATTAVMIPSWWAGSPDDGTGTTTKVHIDYLRFWIPRPSTVS